MLRRVTSAVDTGIAVNPDTIMAQVQGGLIFGLTAALYGEITIDEGPGAAVAISTTIACCASTRRRRSRFMSSTAAKRPAASARPG